jgi:ketosteroid isomerase-like protein
MVEAEINASTERFLQELARGEAAAAASTYDEDAILLPPAGEAVRGRKAIESFWQSGNLEPLERGEAGRLVYEVGRYRMVMQGAEDQPTLERGAYVVLHRQDPDGSWRRAVDTFNRSPSRASEKASGGGKGGSRR